MELVTIRSTTFDRAMRRLGAFRGISLATAEAATLEAPVSWRSSPTTVKDEGDYLLHAIIGW